MTCNRHQFNDLYVKNCEQCEVEVASCTCLTCKYDLCGACSWHHCCCKEEKDA